MSFTGMTLIEIIEQYPTALDVFRCYEKLTGHCYLCSDIFSTLDDVCRNLELEPDLLKAELETVIEASSG